MILPIVFSVFVMIMKFLYELRVPKFNRNLLWGLILSGVGVYFFYKGLDDECDW
jgi:hypothetical protein